MDEIITKAMIIGVSIFITMLIVTVLIFEFTQIQSVYKITAESDVTFENRLDEFDKFRDPNNYFNGLDVKNTIEKYKGNGAVEVCVEVNGVRNCSETQKINAEDYNKKYNVTMEENETKFKIIFNKP